MRSRRELVDRVLENLTILVPGQAPGDEAVSKVDNVIDPAIALLAGLGIVYVADAGLFNPPTGGEIDDPIFLPLATYITWQAAPAFNQGDSASLKALAIEAEELLRVLGRAPSTRPILRTDRQIGGRRLGNFNFISGT